MAKEKQEIKMKQVGKNYHVIVDNKKFTLIAPTKKVLEMLTTKVLIFNKRNSEAKKQEILDILDIKVKKEEEIKSIEKVIKKTRDKDSGDKNEIKTRKTQSTNLVKKVKEFYKTNKIKDDVSTDLVVNKTGYLAMKGCEEISFPDLLVKRIEEFITKKQEIKSLLNFWSLCLLNPNEVARTKLFSYLQNNGLTITPSGYFVTFRMVKKTDNPNEFTHAHNHGGKKQIYIPGTVCSILRSECDEDGSRDCSKGLHTGTPLFIGIQAKKKVDLEEGKGNVGDGYGYTLTTKSQNSGSFGTGYDSPSQEKFDHSFGNQAIICLINPAHVVSIPDSDTRKMRSCEFYFAKLTTAEEVIDMVEKDYLLYDGDYNNFELKQLQEMLKNKHLKVYFDEKSVVGAKVAKLEKELEKRRGDIKLSSDIINDSLPFDSLKSIVKSRIKFLK